jgi:hypothetical protein
MTDPLRKKLEKVRLALLTLHKALVDSERASYEQTMGTIPSPNHFLKLLTDDPWFAWLRPISQLIVSMDEALDTKEEPPSDIAVEALLKETKTLLSPSEIGEGFSRHYFDALQRDPNVILAHAEVTKLFEKRKPK